MSKESETSGEVIRFGESNTSQSGIGVSTGNTGERELFGPPPPPSSGKRAADEKGGKKKKSGKKGKGKKGKKKGPPLVLIIAAGVVVVAAIAVVIILRPWSRGGQSDKTAEESEAPSSQSEEEDPETSEEAGATPTPTPTPSPQTVIQPSTSMAAVETIQSLSPTLLGLEGESMDEYSVYSAVGLVQVDGYPCTEVNVYSVDSATGSNDIQGRYFLSRTSPQHLYRLDTETGVVTELDLPSSSGSSASTQGDTLVDGEQVPDSEQAQVTESAAPEEGDESQD